MFLVTHISEQNDDDLQSVYWTAKRSWERLLRVKQPSLLQIQSGLLLATYENAQALEAESRSTITGCAEMGYKLQLHKSLQKKVVADSKEQIELDEQRCVWWGLVTLER